MPGNVSAQAIDALLPQTQCTRCGYPACRAYAEAIASGEADLNQCPPGGEATRVFAFAQKLPDSAPVGAPKAGYKWHLASFEKAPFAHILSIKYDPYDAAFVAWYIGGFGLVGALIFVFFISHRRYWAAFEEKDGGGFDVIIAGEANRNQLAFSDKFKTVVEEITGRKKEV